MDSVECSKNFEAMDDATAKCATRELENESNVTESAADAHPSDAQAQALPQDSSEPMNDAAVDACVTHESENESNVTQSAADTHPSESDAQAPSLPQETAEVVEMTSADSDPSNSELQSHDIAQVEASASQPTAANHGPKKDNPKPKPRYEFREGRMYVKGTNQTFQYNVYPERSKNQQHYERVGEFATKHVYEQLVAKNLDCVLLPRGKKAPEDAVSFVFASRSLLEDKCERLLVLIHGSGAVRAGIWARSILINSSVEEGTQLPYIQRAIDQGFGVLVMNTNMNSEEQVCNEFSEDEQASQAEQPVEIDGFVVDNRVWCKIPPNSKRTIPRNHSPEAHANYVWENLINNKQSLRDIAIVAHSAGGYVTLSLATHFAEDFMKRVFAVAFTDSVHGGLYSVNKKLKSRLRSIGQNWVASNHPCGTVIERRGYNDGDDVPNVSAGDTRHEWTSHAAIDSIFVFTQSKFTAHMKTRSPTAGGAATASGVDGETGKVGELGSASDSSYKESSAFKNSPVYLRVVLIPTLYAFKVVRSLLTAFIRRFIG